MLSLRLFCCYFTLNIQAIFDRFGEVVQTVDYSDGDGTVRVSFASEYDAQTAQRALHGSRIEGHLITARLVGMTRADRFPMELGERLSNPFKIGDRIGIRTQYLSMFGNGYSSEDAKVIDQENNWIVVRFVLNGSSRSPKKFHVIKDREKLNLKIA